MAYFLGDKPIHVAWKGKVHLDPRWAWRAHWHKMGLICAAKLCSKPSWFKIETYIQQMVERKGPGYYQKLEFELDFGEYKGTTAGAARDGETFQGTYMGFSDFYSGPTMWTHIHFYPERSKTGNFSGWRFIKAGAGHRTSRVTQSIPTNAVTFNFNTGRLNALYQAAEGGTAVGIGSTSGMLRMPGDRGYRIMRFMIETTW
eukprot:Ihof_evm2s899 gene=Ihof_evmTU2s899